MINKILRWTGIIGITFYMFFALIGYGNDVNVLQTGVSAIICYLLGKHSD